MILASEGEIRTLPKAKFHTLDGLCGIAALGVLLLHQHTAVNKIASHAYLAVDLFFILSGFVIAHAYEQKLLSGWSVRDFLRIRLVRLYPLYALGALVGLAYLLWRANGDQTLDGLKAGQIGVVALAAGAFLPSPFAGGGQFWTLNPPSWSLFFELVSNLFYAGLVRRITERALWIWLAAAGLLLTLAVWAQGSANGGCNGETLCLGALRIAFGFPCGVLIQRLYARGALKMRPMHPWLLFLLLTAVCVCPRTACDAAFDLIAIFVLFPLLVVNGALSVPGPSTAAFAAFAGALSYPLYMLHVLVGPAIGALAAEHPSNDPLVRGVIMLAPIPVALSAAWLAERFYDRPLRKALSAWGDSRRSAARLAPGAPAGLV